MACNRDIFTLPFLPYITFKGRWYDIIILNVHTEREDKTDDKKGSCYEELQRVFERFPKYHMKLLLGDFNARISREHIFKPRIKN
jgi:hypothetical protein